MFSQTHLGLLLPTLISNMMPYYGGFLTPNLCGQEEAIICTQILLTVAYAFNCSLQNTYKFTELTMHVNYWTRRMVVLALSFISLEILPNLLNHCKTELSHLLNNIGVNIKQALSISQRFLIQRRFCKLKQLVNFKVQYKHKKLL